MFSTASIVLQFSYLCLVLAAVSTRGHTRLFLAISATTALLHAILWTGSIATIGWMALLLGACLVVLGRDWLSNRRARFTEDEEAMLMTFLAGIPRHAARHFLDAGVWLNGTVGDELTREGEKVPRLVWLANGEALVQSDGRQVATCRAGDLIGEASILTGDPATATVVLAGPARFWCMPAETLHALLEADPQMSVPLERGFARAVRSKLHASNRTIAAAGGVA
ncbi:cyclic nucleotide-binding domain-containing protein [Sphingomonas sp.]|uniref:cyclic nucleotide-binding domain-containing protein n=1 Tax=Sphingomonas sp. TaxID=28214 RepID=UPI001B065A02|nr:cyclic nucleotide-binding domain-containing protein [Sphingomonas sp.]MBO9712102.1 cyclic nucleotide-binding domain-containing protein [Sphingomonas sp.]